MTRKYIAAIILIIFVAGVAIFMFLSQKEEVILELPQETQVVEIQEPESQWPKLSIIGTSTQGRAIEAYTYGEGDTQLLFVGGVHGGYEWNSVLLSYVFIDYLNINKETIPENVRVSIIPVANPDGLYKIVGKEGRFDPEDVIKDVVSGTGRFNSNGVDLNRNFDCKWQPESTWRGNVVDAGTEAFSEPESLAIKDFVEKENPSAVVFWHSKADAVYASECEEGVLSETLLVLNAYSEASGYRAVESFDAYPITGDAEGWLASIGIPAVTVELSERDVIEWEKNLAGIKALFALYSE